WLKLLATLAVSLLFLYLFLRDLDFDAVVESIKDADYELVPLAMLLFAISLVARTFRWQTFYSPGAPRWGILFSTLLITYAGNNLLPLRGGELLRAQILLERANVSRMRTLGVALIERLLDLFLLGLFVILGQSVVDIGIGFLGTGLLVAAGATVGLVLARFVTQGLPGRVASLPWLPLKDSWRIQLRFWGEWLIDGFSVVRSWRLFLVAVFWTAVAWMLEFGMYFVIARAFHIEEGFVTIAFAGAAANLALSVPSSQAGVGPFQWATKEALVKSGVAANAAGAYALALHVLLVVPVTIVGLLAFWLLVPHRRLLISRSGQQDVPAATELQPKAD
ncbi:MAG TPA: lysylphosphatidylglycerol synthase transmembrane domain-containing protein, partial [Dehalococcoidia bacterium]|nr:lysylphosphatidylglycerol synthase transmembrane domain-containing protein [Dehalococcoidia bacterium]